MTQVRNSGNGWATLIFFSHKGYIYIWIHILLPLFLLTFYVVLKCSIAESSQSGLYSLVFCISWWDRQHGGQKCLEDVRFSLVQSHLHRNLSPCLAFWKISWPFCKVPSYEVVALMESFNPLSIEKGKGYAFKSLHSGTLKRIGCVP